MAAPVAVPAPGVQWATLAIGTRALSLEYAWIEPGPGAGEGAGEGAGADAATPLIVFLHEGLGSLAHWREVPQRVCDATGARGLVYSRPGYGRSTPRAPQEIWPVDFLHQQAQGVLPALLQTLGVDAQRQPLWLFGHSDGGSIALLYAAWAPTALAPAGVVVLAPHICVEDCTRQQVLRARQAYEQGDLRARLAAFHDNPDSAFWGWNRTWLLPAFQSWSIEAELARIRCPVLAIQGEGDEYATLAQIEGIARHHRDTTLLALPGCGHWPHTQAQGAVLQAVAAFMARPLPATPGAVR